MAIKQRSRDGVARVNYPLDRSELATVLAALRVYQQQGCGDPANRSEAIHDIATDGDEVISLDDADIDALCERLNCGGES